MKEFKYVTTKEIGVIGDVNSDHLSVEVGHYIVDGKTMSDKVYLMTHFIKRDGTMDSKANSLCQIDEAKAIGELLIQIS